MKNFYLLPGKHALDLNKFNFTNNTGQRSVRDEKHKRAGL